MGGMKGTRESTQLACVGATSSTWPWGSRASRSLRKTMSGMIAR